MLPVFNNSIISHSWVKKQTPEHHLSLSRPASKSSCCPSVSSCVAPHPEHLVPILESACLCFKHFIWNLPIYACLMLFWFIAGLPLTPFLFFGLSDPASDHEHPSAYLPLEITWVSFFDTVIAKMMYFAVAVKKHVSIKLPSESHAGIEETLQMLTKKNKK